MILMYEDPSNVKEAKELLTELTTEANEVMFATKKYGTRFMKQRERVNTWFQRFTTHCAVQATQAEDPKDKKAWQEVNEKCVKVVKSMKASREALAAQLSYIS